VDEAVEEAHEHGEDDHRPQDGPVGADAQDGNQPRGSSAVFRA
jgi:hypothetical protein